MSKELNRMQKLAGVPAKKVSKSLNEHQIGGIVGVRAINQIPPREKSDFEMAFEHFMTEGEEREVEEEVYEEENVKENFSDNDIEEISKIAFSAGWNMNQKGGGDDIELAYKKWNADSTKELESLEGDKITGTDIGDLDTSSSVPDFGDDEITGTSLE